MVSAAEGRKSEMTEREYDAIQYDVSKLVKKVRGGRGTGMQERSFKI